MVNYSSTTSIGSDVSVPAFTKDVGPTVPVADVGDIFSTFFTSDLLLKIVEETNRYANLCRKANLSDDDPPPTEWMTDQDEISAFIGFTILMGLNRLPSLYDYWSVDPLLHYFPRISRKRLTEINWYLHFVNNDTLAALGEEGYSRLQKIEPVIKAVFLTNYNPHQQNAIDEAMIKFKGRSSLKQYMRNKPGKRGIKVWVRADSINGYLCDFNVYTRKEGDRSEDNLGAKVVKALSRPLVGGNYVLYFDNFFSSPRLFLDLLSDNIYACGTYRWYRKGVPEEIQGTKLSEFAKAIWYMCIIIIY